MLTSTICEFCGHESPSKKALYSHRKRCKFYQEYKRVMEEISVIVKKEILEGRTVDINETAKTATDLINEGLDLKGENGEKIIIPITKKKEVSIETVKNIEDIKEINNSEEQTQERSYDKFVRESIQDMHKQLGEIRGLVRKLVEKKSLNEIENENKNNYNN